MNDFNDFEDMSSIDLLDEYESLIAEQAKKRKGLNDIKQSRLCAIYEEILKRLNF